jgi:hypothetical protein
MGDEVVDQEARQRLVVVQANIRPLGRRRGILRRLQQHQRMAAPVRRQHHAEEAGERANICLHDNEALARFLVDNFVAHFGAWRDVPGLRGLAYRPLGSVQASGDPSSSYSETVTAGGLTVRLTWSGLGKPFCFAFPPDRSATGRHYMPSLFVGCQDAKVEVNGRALPGKPVPREIAGHTITTAMLAFSETWIRT